MKRILMAMILLAALAACKEDEPVQPENFLVEYQISMEQIEVPAKVAPDEPLVVKLHGVVGPHSGYWFDHADTVQSASLFELTLFGIHNEDPEMNFLQMLVEWHGHEFVKQPPHVDAVRVVINQADGSILEQTVAVGQ